MKFVLRLILLVKVTKLRFQEIQAYYLQAKTMCSLFLVITHLTLIVTGMMLDLINL